MRSGLLAPVLLLAATCGAQTGPMAVDALDSYVAKTSHTIQVHAEKIDYTAYAGHIPIRSDAGELEGQMFYAAYFKDGADVGSRPITFAYNGGPGSASLWLHMGAIGPKRVAMNDDGSMPAPPYHAVDNEDTWLPSTDIVMVDAMGTGYSRLAKPEFGSRFYGVQQDLRAFTEFVRAFLTKYNRFRSPVYLAGESYGGIRTAGLSASLLRSGIALNGAIIISGTMNYGTLDGARGNDLPFIGFLPTYATTAWYHKKLSPALQKLTVDQIAAQAEEFANGEYAAALLKGTSLDPAEETQVVKRMSALTGLSETYVRQAHLRVTDGRFFKELMRDENKTTGRYDARLTGTDAVQVGDSPDYDPSDAATGPVFYACICDTLSQELNYHTELKYRIWNSDGGGWDEGDAGGYVDTSEALRSALVRNPHMRLLMCYGWYDLACPFGAAHYTLNHMDLNDQALSRISWQYYTAGHMMYIERASREKLARDVAEFIRHR